MARIFLATGPGAGEKTSFIVDDVDAEWVSRRSWQITRGYVSALFVVDGRKQRKTLARMILEVDDRGVEVDHVDRNRLNNTKANLRLATKTQNMANRLPGKGVTFQNGKYMGRITDPAAGRRISKMFHTHREAADWYDQQALRIHGEFAIDRSGGI